jgi:hypothetical protein
MNFFKMFSIHVCFSLGLLQEQDFPKTNLIAASHQEKKRSSAELIANC